MHELEKDKQFLSCRLEGLGQSEKQKFFLALVDDLVAVEDRFGVRFTMPFKMTNDDIDSVVLLKRFMTGDTAEIDEIKGTLVKCVENESTVPSFLRAGGAFRIVHNSLEPQPEIFGIKIPVGSCAMTADRARFTNVEATIKSFEEAKLGEAIEFIVKPEVPVRFELLDGPN